MIFHTLRRNVGHDSNARHNPVVGFESITDATKQYFAMARGYEGGVAMAMTKWFNTNYHYIVPELHGAQEFTLLLDGSKIIGEYNEAKALGIKTKINIIRCWCYWECILTVSTRN